MKRLLLMLVGLMMAAGCSLAEDMPLIEWAPQTSEFPMTGEIGDSWDEIIVHIEDGTARQRYAVGAWKPMDLGEYGIVNMQLAGFDLDTCVDGQGNASTTWIAKELLSKAHRMNPGHDNDKTGTGMIGGWEHSELRSWLNDSVLLSIPKNIAAKIVEVNKSQDAYDSGRIFKRKQTTKDKIWIPDNSEIFGETSLYYGLFQDQNRNRIRELNGSAAWWWLRSAHYINSAYGVGTSGYYGNNYVPYFGGVALGFCL